MALQKCPKCEINYIRDGEKYCDVCRREMKSAFHDAEDQNLCIECGEHTALDGQELCAYCLADKRRREKLEKLMEKPTPLELDMEQLDEIEVPTAAGIPSEDLNEMNKEFGDDEEDDIEAGGEEDGEDDEAESELLSYIHDE